MTPERALEISREVYTHDKNADAQLRAKCRWEHMSRTAMIKTWGDPREWGKEGKADKNRKDN